MTLRIAVEKASGVAQRARLTLCPRPRCRGTVMYYPQIEDEKPWSCILCARSWSTGEVLAGLQPPLEVICDAK